MGTVIQSKRRASFQPGMLEEWQSKEVKVPGTQYGKGEWQKMEIKIKEQSLEVLGYIL